METLLGFKETIANNDFAEDKSCGSKLVPWINWDDWSSVKESLFSSSPCSVASALGRIAAWRSRGCVPVVVEVTASIIEIQLKDPFFRNDISKDCLNSEEMLAMLYSMAIMRLVNGVVEKTRKKTEVSIGEAADAVGIPRMLIDVRHEGSHRDLPSLRLVRLASIKALDWLKYYYWEPQKNAIPSDPTGKRRKDIESVLHELFLSLNVRQTSQSNSSILKGKRVIRYQPPCGPNKILSLMTRKLQSSNSAGSKKQIAKLLKNLVSIYSSYSSEVVSVLLELLLKASHSSDVIELVKSSYVCHNNNSVQTTELDDWKPVIIKLSNKEPELLLTLLKAVLDMIETWEFEKDDFEHQTSEYEEQSCQIERLCYLFEWLIGNWEGLKPLRREGPATGKTGFSTEENLPNTTLVEFLRKCLLLSSPGNNHLMNSALVLARITRNVDLVETLNKLAYLHSPIVLSEEESYPLIGNFLSEQEDSLRQAAEKLEFFKLQRMKKNNNVKTRGGAMETRNRWTIAKSWNPCPIGMLPRALGSSGQFPVLNCDNSEDCQFPAIDVDDSHEVGKPPESKGLRELNKCNGKREADCAFENLDGSSLKRLKESGEGFELNEKGDQEQAMEGFKGHLMIDGVWKKVGEEEMLRIASAIRILV